MALTGVNNEQKMWNFFKKSGLNDYGCAGMMGNSYAECGLSPINLQNNGNTALSLTDEEFTKKVDDGSYSKDKFIHDGYGYGLAQWTFWSLKQELYEFAKSKNVSIGDLEMQLTLWITQLNRYSGFTENVKNATSVKQASDFVLLNFERPASVGPNATDKQREDTCNLRASYAQGYYNKYASKVTQSTELTYKVGDIVDFNGTTHYTSATAANGVSCKPGTAKVSSIYKTGKHPYHLVSVAGGGSTVHGWVNAEDILCLHTEKNTQSGGNNMGYTNSSLVDCVVKSPNHSGTRTHKIDRITPHCVVGQLTAESIGGCFTSSSRQASCNYGIGTKGRVCLCVDEQNRSWCSSSRENDQRAITIECASDLEAPYTFNSAVYNKLVELCIDICKRNGLKKVLWFGDKTKSLNYTPKNGECVLTVHRWFANKSCPGDWMYARMGQLANEINAGLGNTAATTPSVLSTSSSSLKYKVGDIVDFTGTTHYSSATAKTGSSCKAGVAKVTAVYKNGIHPYHLIREANGGSTVYGWVDVKDITGIHGAAFEPYLVKVTTSNLNIRTGPDATKYPVCGSIKDMGTYTIVKEATASNGGKWGYLKSGAGWISLNYCKKV